MESNALVASSRSIFGKNSKGLRRDRQIPGVIYGKGMDNVSITLSRPVFTKLWQTVGESGLIDLSIDDKKSMKVIIQTVQTDPLSGDVLHADLHKINMNEPLETDIPLTFTGEAAAVKEHGGILVRNIDHVRVRALPGDLVHDIELSLDSLKTFDDIIRVKDLPVNDKLQILTEADELIAKVQPPRTEEELKALDEVVEEDVQGVEKVEGEEEETDEEDEKAGEAETKTEETDSDNKELTSGKDQEKK